MRSGMSQRLDKWAAGDSPVTVLDECLLLAKSETPFPYDALQTDIRHRALDARQRLDRKLAILWVLHAGKQADAFLVRSGIDPRSPDQGQLQRRPADYGSVKRERLITVKPGARLRLELQP